MKSKMGIENYLDDCHTKSIQVSNRLKTLAILLQGFKPERELENADFARIGYLLEDYAKQVSALSEKLDVINRPE